MRRWIPGPGLLACALIVAGLSASSGAQTPEADHPAAGEVVTGGTPRIEFATSSHDFGTRVAGDDLKTTFEFKNVGDGVLHIVQVKGG